MRIGKFDAFEAAGLLVSAIEKAGADSLGVKTVKTVQTAQTGTANPLTENINGACLIFERNPNFSEVGGVTRIQFGRLKHSRAAQVKDTFPASMWHCFTPDVTADMAIGTSVTLGDILKPTVA